MMEVIGLKLDWPMTDGLPLAVIAEPVVLTIDAVIPTKRLSRIECHRERLCRDRQGCARYLHMFND